MQLSCTREMLTSLAQILATAGERPEAMSQEFSRICRGLEPPEGTNGNSRASRLNDAHVISHWYSDPQYLDGSGMPRALAFAGPTPSLNGLIAQVLPEANPEAILASLKDLGAVREERGLYRPTARYVSFAEQREDTIFWLLTALRGVLHAIEYNAAADPVDRILARAAINPRFPVRALPVFHAGLRNHAGEFLKHVDADMQLREVPGSDEGTTELGVVVLAFENPQVTGRKTGSKAGTPHKSRGRKGR